jgi:hypothetical protein
MDRTVTPLEARAAFKLHRRLLLAGLVAGTAVFFMCWHFADDWFSGGATIVFFGLFLGWVRSAWKEGFSLKMFCPSCGKYLPLGLAWRCGYCDARNFTGHPCSIVLPCVCCGKEAKAFQCFRCEAPVFFTPENDASYIAKGWRSPPAGETEEEARARMAKERKARLVDEREQRQHAIMITRLDAELAAEQRKLKLMTAENAQKSSKERLEEDFESFRTMTLGVEELADRELKRAEAEFKDDPDRLERYRLVITTWRDKNLS